MGDPQHPTYVCRLLELGFCGAKFDTSLFVQNDGVDITILLVYVDDILLTGSNDSILTTLIHDLDASFNLKDLGLLHYFLGVEAHFSSSGLFLSQWKYIQDFFLKTKTDDAKP